MTIRVLLVDDHPVVRRGLAALLGVAGDFEVVGEAGDGIEAVDLAKTTRPDVVVMDLQLPHLNGVEATRRITQQAPGTAVLVLSMREDDEAVLSAMAAGARGYTIKGSDPSDVARAVESVARGDAVFGPGIATRILAELSKPRPTDPLAAFPTLTDREAEVLDLLAQGLHNPEIAKRLGIAAKTVRNHVSNIFTKLAVVDRTEALLRAREAGLGPQ